MYVTHVCCCAAADQVGNGSAAAQLGASQAGINFVAANMSAEVRSNQCFVLNALHTSANCALHAIVQVHAAEAAASSCQSGW